MKQSISIEYNSNNLNSDNIYLLSTHDGSLNAYYYKNEILIPKWKIKFENPFIATHIDLEVIYFLI